MVVKKIGILSLGKVSGFLYGVFGLLVGLVFTLVSLLGGFPALEQAGPPDIFLRLMVGAGSFLFLPLFYGVMGFISGLLMAVIYNFIAAVTGGLEIELEGSARP